MRICEFEGCGKKHEARGYCQGHYIQFRKGKDLQPLGSSRAFKSICQQEDCGKAAVARGLCDHHYRKLRKAEGYIAPKKPLEQKRAEARDYYKKRKESDPNYKKETNRKWRQRNPEKCLEYSKKWRQNNKEKVAEKNRKWRECNDRSDYMRSWSQNNRDKRHDSFHKWRVAKTTNGGYEQISRSEVWIEEAGICYLCLKQTDFDNWHLEHIVPLSRGGSHTRNNVHVACPSCNLSKKDKLLDEYLEWRRLLWDAQLKSVESGPFH